MKQQSALIAIPEEWILLLSGVQRRDTRLSIELHVARRLALRRITRLRARRWCGRDGACVGECGEAQSGTADDASGSDGGRNEADEVTRHGRIHFEFALASDCLVLSRPVSITDLVRELVTAPKLRIRPLRVAVVLTTRVMGDLRLFAFWPSARVCDRRERGRKAPSPSSR
jgi:hypothetical protein